MNIVDPSNSVFLAKKPTTSQKFLPTPLKVLQKEDRKIEEQMRMKLCSELYCYFYNL